ncbi:MAG: radical SAM family heme chaperone HemW [Chloroflexi bacterium]|nr:radical SAM family heme chaperone HemW [Chloroflexota bacterium]
MSDSLALFVFIPFCKIKCTYCDFNAYANLARVMEPYADAVAREIVRAKHSRDQLGQVQHFTLGEDILEQHDSANASPLHAKTIYFGGGTPSLVPVAHIEKILRACESAFAIAPDAEITLEANPGTLDADKLRALRALGVNRLSIGVQAFDDAALRRLNRGHTVADAFAMFDHARRAGFDNLNLDFIYGLPLQTLDDWRATLDRAIALAPEHLSLYALKVEEGTGLEHQIARGKYAKPDDDLAAEMYELAEDVLDAAGYAQYEISNWSLEVGNWKLDSRIPTSNLQPPSSNLQQPTPNFQSRHNLTYWRNEPYLGFGAGAHSYATGRRYWNVLSPVEYIARIARGDSAMAEHEIIDRAIEMAETMFLGLRLNEGVAFETFAQRFGENARDTYGKEMKELREVGLIEIDDVRVRLTRRGRLLSNEVFWRFLP